MEQNIQSYTTAVNSMRFQRFKSNNYYQEVIKSWTTNELELSEDSISKFRKLVKDFVFILDDLAVKTFDLFSAAHRVEGGENVANNRFSFCLRHIESNLEEIFHYKDVVIVNVQKQQKSEAEVLQATLLNLIDKFYNLMLSVGVNLIESPLHKKIQKPVKAIKRIKIPKHIKTNDVPMLKNEKPIEDNLWFKIGLTFATGKAQALYKVHKNYSEVARQLNFDNNYRNFFAGTLANTVTGNKNIYSQPNKIKEIYNYCERNNIEVVEDFRKHLPKTT